MTNIKTIHFDDVIQRVMPAYADSDIIIIDDISNLQIKGKTAFRMDFVMLIGCTQGMAEIELKSKNITLKENELLCYIPNSVTSSLMLSPDFKAIIICMTTKIMQEILRKDKCLMGYYLHISNNPILNIGAEGHEMLEHYKQFCEYRIRYHNKKYQKEAVTSLLSAGLYDILGSFDYNTIAEEKNEFPTQGDMLFKRFIEMISASNNIERSVKFYADKLYVSPKYLSMITKKVSGRTAYEWITGQVVAEIDYQLRYSDLSIKEIANNMQFPNLSFFGRYVKEHLGASPTEYRKNANKQKKEMGRDGEAPF